MELAPFTFDVYCIEFYRVFPVRSDADLGIIDPREYWRYGLFGDRASSHFHMTPFKKFILPRHCHRGDSDRTS